MSSFVPSMMVFAREARGLTQTALAELLATSQARVSRVEDGLLDLSVSDLARWAAALGISVEALKFNPESEAPSLSFYRRAESVPIKQLRKATAMVLLRRAEILRSCSGSSGVGPSRLPHIPVQGLIQAAEAAKVIRERWGVGRGPLKGLTRRIQEEGCVVEVLDFDFPKLDGVAIGAGTSIPTVFLRAGVPTDRMRLSVAHELGHLILHRTVHELVEEEAWAFANELMMPSDVIRAEFAHLSLDHLLRLKLKWQVSMQALLRRAQSLDMVSEREARFLWMRLSQSGFRRVEPGSDQLEPDLPSPTNQGEEGRE